MEISRFFWLLCLSWDSFIFSTHQFQSSQTQVLLQLRKQLQYPKQLDFLLNPGTDPCFSSSSEANITCQENFITGIRIFGDRPTRSQNFSMDSLVATLSRLNGLRVLSLASLGLWGPIPDKIHRLQSLEYLDLSWNFLYGTIPPTISRIVSLQILKLDGNLLTGSFPDWLHSLPNLTSLSFGSNSFSGSLPSSIEKVSTLTDINLSKNALSGKLPNLSSLLALRWLDLSNNKFDSLLPKIPNGVIAALLANNSFSGRIPEQYSHLNQLQQLDVSFNSLTEKIPEGIFALPDIVSINLASNMLMGSLPMHLNCGSHLQSLDMSNNKLVGMLPSCLSGKKAFKFGGNCFLTDLQQQHPETYCSQNFNKRKESEIKNVALLILVFGGIAILVLLLVYGIYILCRCCVKKSERQLVGKAVQENSVTGSTAEIIMGARFISTAAKSGLLDLPPHRLFSLDELKVATNSFESSTLIGEGSTGKLYRGRLENGAQVAIRCLTVSRKYTIRNLKLRLSLLAKLRHPHLVCLLGHCIESERQDQYGGASKVYLVYEYVSNGSYQDHLSETNLQKGLKWSDRLAILIGIAKAVHFLHTGVIPGFYNNRLKANNILLNENHVAKLSDYGLSVVALELLDKKKEEDGLRSWEMKSLEDDVYSFGFIILESLIGPSLRSRKESFLLNEMVSIENLEGQRRIVDQMVLATSCQESLSMAISLTMNCISRDVSARPSFEDVLWNLQYAAQVQANSVGNRRV